MVDGRDLALAQGLLDRGEPDLQAAQPAHARQFKLVAPLFLLVGDEAWLGLGAMIVVALGVVVAILLFERPRAKRIEQDLKDDTQH